MLRQYILFIVLFIVWYNEVIANNSSYITLSNQIARSRTLSILANNAANSSTIGYMEDELILHKVDRRQNKKKNNSFVKAYNTFLPKVDGSLKVTNRNLDLAIIGNGYFKVLTSLGVRYTLNGMIFLDNQGNLINQDGLPFLSNDNQLINIPLDTSDIYVNKDGVIYANKEEVAQIGVFDFIGESNLNKEGSGLYATTSEVFYQLIL